MENVVFDFYYGKEAEQFSFFRIPRMLIKDPRFKKLSNDAKLLYGLMLDRMDLSMKNEWVDIKNRVYIIYKVEDIIEDLGCSKTTSIKILKELDAFGLIKKVHSGFGRPDIIYVKNFVKDNKEEPKRSEELKENSNSSYQKEPLQGVKNFDFIGTENELPKVQKMDFCGKENGLHEVQNFNPISYTDSNYTKSSDTNLIYPPSKQERSEQEPAKNEMDRIDKMDETIAYRILVRKNLEYDLHIADPHQAPDLFQEIYEIICDIVCIKRTKVRINGQDCPYEIVKSRFLKLNYRHIEYVMHCLRKNTVKVANIKAYLITALYNAPLTMNSYYQQEVQHDMYGVG